MKMKSALIFCSFLLLTAYNTSYAQIQTNLLDTKWKVVFDKYTYVANMSEAEWQAHRQKSVEEREKFLNRMKEEAERSVFIFGSDLSFTVMLDGEILEQGEWLLQSDGKTIIAKNDRGFEDIITLKEVGQNKIVIDSKQYGQEVVLIPLIEEN